MGSQGDVIHSFLNSRMIFFKDCFCNVNNCIMQVITHYLLPPLPLMPLLCCPIKLYKISLVFISTSHDHTALNWSVQPGKITWRVYVFTLKCCELGGSMVSHQSVKVAVCLQSFFTYQCIPALPWTPPQTCPCLGPAKAFQLKFLWRNTWPPSSLSPILMIRH